MLFPRMYLFAFNIEETLEDSNSIGVRTMGMVRYDPLVANNRGRREVASMERHPVDADEARLFPESARHAPDPRGMVAAGAL